MAIVKPFSCIRPTKEFAMDVAALPYDVYSSKEARKFIAIHPKSFLAIDRAETNFSEDINIYSKEVYEKANSLLQNWIAKGIFIKDEEQYYYLYELTMNGRTQTGIVGCVSIDDYINNVVKKHENTRVEKEQDRIRHIKTCHAQTGPIFLAYKSMFSIQSIVAEVKKEEPLYDFKSEDGIRHRVFRVIKKEWITELEKAFLKIPSVYIADGHHRAASAVKVGLELREQMGTYTGKEEFNYFLSVLFPEEELMILEYNRVVKDLNGMSEEQFLHKVETIFDVIPMDTRIKPSKKGEFTMYLSERWYLCKAKENMKHGLVENLDVSILQNYLLEPVLKIKDPKTDKRIDFVGGIKDLEELENRCHQDCKVAFVLYPISTEELFKIADEGMLMPPKSTWFEPKLRSGLFIHKI